MDVIDSKIDVNSETFKTNYKEMTALVEDLNRELDIAMNQRSEKAVQRHKESGKIPAARKLELLLDRGARLAEPGEFTLRAFLNGKIDLSQAEAVADLIASQSKAAHQLALNQMRASTTTGGAYALPSDALVRWNH